MLAILKNKFAHEIHAYVSPHLECCVGSSPQVHNNRSLAGTSPGAPRECSRYRTNMINRWLYTIRERFTAEIQPRFQSYQSFSGFTAITELVTLDSMMCPEVIDELVDEDWHHNVYEDFRTSLFRDLDYLLSRGPLDRSRHQIVAIRERPDGSESIPSGFERCGHDIMDSYFGNSTLTNCGPVPEAFNPTDVNTYGLIDDRNTAYAIRDKMRILQPDDPHLGACEVWLLARRLPNVRS
jgi:hypothetical protein